MKTTIYTIVLDTRHSNETEIYDTAADRESALFDHLAPYYGFEHLSPYHKPYEEMTEAEKDAVKAMMLALPSDQWENWKEDCRQVAAEQDDHFREDDMTGSSPLPDDIAALLRDVEQVGEHVSEIEAGLGTADECRCSQCDRTRRARKILADET